MRKYSSSLFESLGDGRRVPNKPHAWNVGLEWWRIAYELGVVVYALDPSDEGFYRSSGLTMFPRTWRSRSYYNPRFLGR